MKWLRWLFRRNTSAHTARIDAEAKLRKARRETARFHQHARDLAALPADELADRLREAMTVRWSA